MQILWTHEFSISSSSWEPDLFGVFYFDKYPQFLFKEVNQLRNVSCTGNSCLNMYIPHGNRMLPLPCEWIFAGESRKIVLCSSDIAVDLFQKKCLQTVPESLRIEYHAAHKTEKHLVEDAFVWEDYCISHKGPCGYCCTANGEPRWEFQGRGYLYTELFRWNNRVFFGTAGRGGYFYVLDINNGSLVAAVNTGGTSNFVHNDNFCYFTVKQKSGPAKLVCVDIKSGSIQQEILIPGVATKNSRIQRIGEHIYVLTFNYKSKILNSVNWICVKL